MIYAILYSRFSPRPNAQACESCDRQEERCILYCGKKGYCIVGSFEDPNVSGGTLDRPGLNAAIDRVREVSSDEQKMLDEDDQVVLVVDSADRLARDMLVSLTLRHEIKKAGGSIEFANGMPVSGTPEGLLFSNILAAFGAYERDRIRYATARGMKRRQAEGEFFGKPLCGWQRDPNYPTTLVECPQEQDGIASAKCLEKSGFSSVEIARIITKRHGPFRGKPWSARTVRRILSE